MRQGEQVYYLHGDHLGSTSLTTDINGQLTHEARSLPYGQMRWEPGASATDFGFTGQRHESSFGLMDFNARYYNAQLGTFISPDTIVPDPTKGDDYNRYLFVRGNPLKYTDPSGHFSVKGKRLGKGALAPPRHRAHWAPRLGAGGLEVTFSNRIRFGQGTHG